MINRADSYLEASAAAGFALALGRALRMGLAGLDAAPARAAYERALAALCDQINDRGEFTGVSQQTPPGDFAFYNSIALGAAPVIRDRSMPDGSERSAARRLIAPQRLGPEDKRGQQEGDCDSGR